MNLKVKMKSLQSAFHFCSQWHSVLSHQIYILGWLLVTAYQLLFGRGICHLLWWLFFCLEYVSFYLVNQTKCIFCEFCFIRWNQIMTKVFCFLSNQLEAQWINVLWLSILVLVQPRKCPDRTEKMLTGIKCITSNKIYKSVKLRTISPSQNVNKTKKSDI